MPRLFEENEVVVVTGGASGLGEVLVRMFASEGARVAFTFFRSKQKAEILKKELGDCVYPLYADASEYTRAHEVIDEIVDYYGRIDALVNNAAAAQHDAFLNLNSEDMRYSLDNTFMPVFNYTQAVAKFFVEQQRGSIVQIGSINGERGREGSAPYCAAKAAVEGMSKTVAKELGRFNIRCNVVSPGYIATEGQKHTSPLIHRMVLGECAMPHLATPQEVGELVLFLASKKARAVTGQVYRIDYGQYI